MGNCMDTTARVDHSMNNATCECPASLSRILSHCICIFLSSVALNCYGGQ
jgi:hypothetical protein